MGLQKTEIGVHVKVKLVVNKATNRVLFAVAGKDFVNFLFQIQELPLGVVSQLVRSVSDDSICCVSSIRDSIKNLPDSYMISSQKAPLLFPEVRNCGLKLRVLLEQFVLKPRTMYSCSNRCGKKYFSDNPHVQCPGCSNMISINAGQLVAPSDAAVMKFHDGEGGYVRGLVTYLVTDDLAVKPMQVDSCFYLLEEYNIGNIRDIQEEVVSVGLDEGKKLLEAALRSKTALTDTFLPKKP